ncbi:MAG: hypothetical protein QG585_324 [Patescibacteria group bacterium]|nr:hypothetical protein [Patescibacteria group bacterium]
MITVILLSLAGAVVAAVVGTFWYSNSTPMGKIHMKSLGFDTLSPSEQKQKMEEAKPMMPKMYAAQMALSFLTAFAVVFITTMSVQNGLPFKMVLIFVGFNWLCFIVPTVGGAILWSNTDRSIAWKKFFSDILSSLVTLLLIAFLASLFV